MKDDILKFISRFSSDNTWLNGNCYYFSIILKCRFPEAIIYYDVISGHFITLLDGCLYDASGEYHRLSREELYSLSENPVTVKLSNNIFMVNWERFSEYDELQKERIINDCVM